MREQTEEKYLKKNQEKHRQMQRYTCLHTMKSNKTQNWKS